MTEGSGSVMIYSVVDYYPLSHKKEAVHSARVTCGARRVHRRQQSGPLCFGRKSVMRNRPVFKRGEVPDSVEDLLKHLPLKINGKCLECYRGLEGRGKYPTIKINKTRWRISRLLLSLRGENIEGLQAIHSCDNPVCVNPEHIRAGTGKENMAECVSRGRINRGELRPRAKLTEHKVRCIRQLRNLGMKQIPIAEIMGVSQQHICKILQGGFWGWLK